MYSSPKQVNKKKLCVWCVYIQWSNVNCLCISYFFNWVITVFVLCWCKWCKIVRTVIKPGKVVYTQPPQMIGVILTSVLSNWAVFTPDINIPFNRIYLIVCSLYKVVNCVVRSDCFYMVFTQVVCECPSVIILCVAIPCDSTECTLWWPDNEIKKLDYFPQALLFTYLYTPAISSCLNERDLKLAHLLIQKKLMRSHDVVVSQGHQLPFQNFLR